MVRGLFLRNFALSQSDHAATCRERLRRNRLFRVMAMSQGSAQSERTVVDAGSGRGRVG